MGKVENCLCKSIVYDRYFKAVCVHPVLILSGLWLAEDLQCNSSKKIFICSSGICLMSNTVEALSVVNSRPSSFSSKLPRKQFLRFIAVLMVFDLEMILFCFV